jgi:hypothetical protein
MIVTWSETYLRTSLTNAFNTVRQSPPNISSYLIEPTPPVIERSVHVTPSPTTRLSSIINKTDHEREAAAAAAATTTTMSSNPSWQANLPDVCVYFILKKSDFNFIICFKFRIGFQLLFEM